MMVTEMEGLDAQMSNLMRERQMQIRRERARQRRLRALGVVAVLSLGVVVAGLVSPATAQSRRSTGE